MARFKKNEEIKENGAAVKPKSRKPIEIYVVPLKQFAFSVKVVDPDGNKIQLRDVHTNALKFLDDGTPVFMERTHKFTNVIEAVNRGTLAEYYVYEDTDQAIKDRLEELCADTKSSVMTREDWIKNKNPDQWAEIQRRKQLAEELAGQYTPVIEKQSAEIEALQAQIAELQKGA